MDLSKKPESREAELEVRILHVIEGFEQMKGERDHWKKIADEGLRNKETIKLLRGRARTALEDNIELRRTIEDKDREIEDLKKQISNLDRQRQEAQAQNRAYKLLLKERGNDR
jgi:predicted RNase H-like nuclease (RuvC/YqgF family)